jgi:hypothetical protein
VKKSAGTLNAIPSKRIFLSIIADYDLERSICELVDNAIDNWIRSGRKSTLNVGVGLDAIQQTITVSDNAGGVKQNELSFIVGPGQTGSKPTEETIGIFGVGTKRAVVALAQQVKIKTRFGRGPTFQIEFDDDWLEDEDWRLPLYEVTSIHPSSTVVELSRLREPMDAAAEAAVVEHLSATYAKFIDDGRVGIEVNGKPVPARFFDNWAYPPRYEPRHFTGSIPTSEHGTISVNAYAGLSRESSPAAGEYGVYFYCNDRLVARAMKTFDVGFLRGYAGLPHPKVSLTKVIIELKGDARAMPWNSSKSDISTKHEVFRSIHVWLLSAVKEFATLSRIWMGDWPEKVFSHKAGKMVEVELRDFPIINTTYLPPLPKSRFKFAEKVSEANRPLRKKKPWVAGLYEGVIAADLINKQDFEQSGRITLIVLDSTLEIALKEFLVNESGKYYSDRALLNIFSSRHEVMSEVLKYVQLDHDDIQKIGYYNGIRNKLIHQRASGSVPESEVEDYRKVVESVLKTLFKIKFPR